MNDLTASLRPVQKFLAKHHAVLFICLLALLLSAAIFALYDVSREAEQSTGTPIANSYQFDKVTIDKIKSLHSSTDTFDTFTFPTARYNPFVE